jgi:hypothetical protein
MLSSSCSTSHAARLNAISSMTSSSSSFPNSSTESVSESRAGMAWPARPAPPSHMYSEAHPPTLLERGGPRFCAPSPQAASAAQPRNRAGTRRVGSALTLQRRLYFGDLSCASTHLSSFPASPFAQPTLLPSHMPRPSQARPPAREDGGMKFGHCWGVAFGTLSGVTFGVRDFAPIWGLKSSQNEGRSKVRHLRMGMRGKSSATTCLSTPGQKFGTFWWCRF